jgi:hypothetical protein
MYVKTMSAHGSHLGWRSWLPDTILKVYYPRTIHAMFAFKANMAWMVLNWSIFKIVSGDPDLHPRWLPAADIVLTWDLMGNHLRTIHAMFALNWLTGFRGKKN